MTLCRTAYSPQLRCVKEFAKPSRTKQEFKDECDINNIVENFLKTGRLEAFDEAKARYLDMTQIPASYQEALQLVVDATEAFDALPANARELFGNDVNTFLQAAYEQPDAVFGPRNADGVYEPPLATTPAPAPTQAPPASPEPQPAPLPQATS